MKIPTTAPADVQAAFREVWGAVDRWNGPLVDLRGRRLINAGQAIDPFDYATRADVDDAVAGALRDQATTTVAPSAETVLYGTHAQRLSRGAGTVRQGTIFYETDRAAIYQAQLSAGTMIWALVMCRPLRTSATKPADLTTDDAGFTWFDQVEGVTYRWSGTAWNYYLGSLVDAFANRPSDALADRGFLFVASDYGYHVWRKGATTWVLVEGCGGPYAVAWASLPTLGTADAGFAATITDRGYQRYRWSGTAWVYQSGYGIPLSGVIGSIVAGLGANDAGFEYHATDYNRTYRWSGAAWADAPDAPPRYQIAWFDAAPEPAAGWGLCDGAATTRSTATGGTAAYTPPDLITNKPVIRGHSTAGGTGGAATHTHAADPPDTASGVNSAGQEVQAGAGVTVAADAHTHQVDVASFTSGAATSYPFYYEALPYVRL